MHCTHCYTPLCKFYRILYAAQQIVQQIVNTVECCIIYFQLCTLLQTTFAYCTDCCTHMIPFLLYRGLYSALYSINFSDCWSLGFNIILLHLINIKFEKYLHGNVVLLFLHYNRLKIYTFYLKSIADIKKNIKSIERVEIDLME